MRRVINIELTDAGRKSLEEKLDKINHVINDRISVLSSQEIELGIRAMKDLTETMTKIIENNDKK